MLKNNLCDEQNNAHIEKNYIKKIHFLLQLVDLKAELYRKQEQFKHDKLGQENGGASLTSKSKLKVNMFILTFSIMSLTNVLIFIYFNFLMIVWTIPLETECLEQTECWCFSKS